MHALPGRFPSRRGALEARVDVGGRPVTVLCTHLVHLGGLMRPLRRRQIEQLAHHLDRLEGPWAIAGDFNTLAHDEELAPLAATGLRLHPQPEQRLTFPARRPRWKLDHIGAAPGWEWLACTAIPATASDHLPLLAELRWKGP